MYGYKTKPPPSSQEVNKLQPSQRFHLQIKWLLSTIITIIIIKIKLVYQRILKACLGIFIYVNKYLLTQIIKFLYNKYLLTMSI